MFCILYIVKGETNEMKRLVLELPDEKHQEFKEKAVRINKSMRKILTELIEKWLKK